MPGVQALIRFTDLSLHWPEVVRFRERVAGRYRPKVRADCVVILPCSKRKPYSMSRSHRLFSGVIRPVRRRVRIEEIVLTSPLGAVPRALETVPPARNYDIAVTGIWSEEELAITSHSLSSVLRACAIGNTDIVAHVSGGYLDSCRRAEADLGWSFRYTGVDRPASSAGLQALSDLLAVVDGHPIRHDPLEAIRHVLSYQYGEDIADAMTLPPAKKSMMHRVERILCEGKRVVRRNPFTGLFIPETEGARIMVENDAYCVDIDFRPKTNVIYCPGITSADEAIRPGDEVVVRYKGQPVGQGRSILCGREMIKSERGKALTLREIFA